jgi:hypothetical protein
VEIGEYPFNAISISPSGQVLVASNSYGQMFNINIKKCTRHVDEAITKLITSTPVNSSSASSDSKKTKTNGAISSIPAPPLVNYNKISVQMKIGKDDVVKGGYKGIAGAIRCVAFHPLASVTLSPPLLACSGLDRYLHVYDQSTTRHRFKIYLKQRISSLVFSPEIRPKKEREEEEQAAMEQQLEAQKEEEEEEQVWGELETVVDEERDQGEEQEVDEEDEDEGDEDDEDDEDDDDDDDDDSDGSGDEEQTGKGKERKAPVDKKDKKLRRIEVLEKKKRKREERRQRKEKEMTSRLSKEELKKLALRKKKKKFGSSSFGVKKRRKV